MKRQRNVARSCCAWACMTVGGAAAAARGQCELAKLIAPDAAAVDVFGVAVAVSGDTAVIGATYDDHSGEESAGSAYVFVRSGPRGCEVWTQQATLTASDAAAFDLFGWSVAVWGDTVVIGAIGDEPMGVDSGSAYVFAKPDSGWVDMTETAKLTASDAADGDSFGFSVAVSGDTVLVGAEQNDHAGGSNAGAAYVFVMPGGGWVDMTEMAKLTASDASTNDRFGRSVAMSGDTAIIGAWRDVLAGVGAAGSAYVFVRGHNGNNVWDNGFADQQAKLIASDAANLDGFGYSVALSGDTAVIGAWRDDHVNGTMADEGSAYVFVRSAMVWTQQAKLTASDAAALEEFGISVAVSGDTAVVGAANHDDKSGTVAGSAYVFIKPSGGWTNMSERAKLTASDAAAGDWFGYSVALSGDTTVIGAYGDTHAGMPYAGSAYVFDLNCQPACQADINNSNAVDVDDLLAIINAWGPCPRPCPPSCVADIAPAGAPAGDNTVNVDDLLMVINAWGPCE